MSTLFARLNRFLPWILLVCCLILVFRVWTSNGFDSMHFDTDMARDLKEISNIQAGNLVWLGPWLAPGLHASSIYYYLFAPAVILSGGKVASLFAMNLLFAMVSLLTFGICATRKYRAAGAMATLIWGLLPVLSRNVTHPGNGYTYVFFSFLALTTLWFRWPLIVSSLLAGCAFALHPAAGFLGLFLLLQWWQRGRKWLSALASLGAFLTPLAPLLIFEAITKGYITRNFLAHPSSNGMSWGIGIQSWQILAQQGGVSVFVFVALLLFTAFTAWKNRSERSAQWFGVALLCLIPITLIQGLIDRYLFGLALVLIFSGLAFWLKHRWAPYVFLVFAAVLLWQSALFFPTPPAVRNITRIESVADSIVASSLSEADRSQPVAVVAALTPGTEVPQADDYRFLLRNRGVNVVDATQNSQAETLLMVVEVPGFAWQNWSTWEIETFGAKEVHQVSTSQDITVITFHKKD